MYVYALTEQGVTRVWCETHEDLYDAINTSQMLGWLTTNLHGAIIRIHPDDLS
jgi:hypothetical protein